MPFRQKSHSMYPWAWASWPSACPWYWQTVKSNQHTSGSTDSWDWCWACWAVHLPWVHSQRWPTHLVLHWHLSQHLSCYQRKIFFTGRKRYNLVILCNYNHSITCSRDSGQPDLEKGKRRYLRTGAIYNNI